MKPKIFLIITCLILYIKDFQGQPQLEVAFPNLNFNAPVELQPPSDGTDRIFVVEQAGIIKVFENDPLISNYNVFLDISSQVVYNGERGLLGLAFHPDYASNGYFYIYYSIGNPNRTRISRFSVSSTNPDSADESSESVILDISQPASNHNGGKLQFGPDGYLYIAVGDGGGAGDPSNNGQNRATLLGSILRIDINSTSGGNNYSIPSDNPFFGNSQGYREEIYAYGLRNPWRFSFDPATGMLWAGDVGQGAWEEIDIIESGKNYGWRLMEGFHCYNPPTGCDTTGLTMPIWEYAHGSSGGYSITGGYVHRADPSSSLYGKYIYGDYVTGNIWTLEYDGVNPAINNLLFNTSLNIASFGIDKYNNIYVCAFDGKIYRLETPYLPVELTSFTISKTDNFVILNWSTATETNNSGFYIERSPDDLDYTSIGFVEGSGTTSAPRHYVFTDENQGPGNFFYRLKQTDFDGTFQYSQVLSIKLHPSLFNLGQNYPNPFNPSTTIEFTLPVRSDVNLNLFNALGQQVSKLIKQNFDAGTHSFKLNAAELPSGVYFYTIEAFGVNGNNFKSVKKLVLLK